MTLAQIQIVGGNGRETVELSSTSFAAKLDGQIYRPAVTTSVEIENDGDVSATKDQCGHTERKRVGNQGWQIRVQGMVTANTLRQGNLSMQQLRDVIAQSDEIEIISDVLSGTFAVSNVVITQPNDLVSIVTEDTNGEEKAFEFQLQLGESESD
jgi:hypothetical protein